MSFNSIKRLVQLDLSVGDKCVVFGQLSDSQTHKNESIQRHERSTASTVETLVFSDAYVMVNEQVVRIPMNMTTLLYVSLFVCFIVSLRHSWQFFSNITMRKFDV